MTKPSPVTFVRYALPVNPSLALQPQVWPERASHPKIKSRSSGNHAQLHDAIETTSEGAKCCHKKKSCPPVDRLAGDGGREWARRSDHRRTNRPGEGAPGQQVKIFARKRLKTNGENRGRRMQVVDEEFLTMTSRTSSPTKHAHRRRMRGPRLGY